MSGTTCNEAKEDANMQQFSSASAQIDPAFLDALPEELRDEVLFGYKGLNMDGCMQSRYVLGKKLRYGLCLNEQKSPRNRTITAQE
nr:hypothetical protein [Tanacetum cinerariifolium]